MKIEFQEDLLKFLIQKKEGKKYVEVLEPDLFDLDTHKTVFQLLKSFIKKYRSLPSLGNLLEYFDREIKQSKFKGEDLGDVYREIEETIRDLYIPITANTDQIREVILEEYQLKLMRNLFIENAGKLKTATADIVKEVFKQVSDIKRIGETDLDEEQNKGVLALAQFERGRGAKIEAHPTYLHSLNRMTSTGGFYAPQLIIFMGGPKSFKTGFLINLAVNYVRAGKKCYYVDCENGEGRILDRFYQAMLEATWEEYSSGELDDTLEEMVGRFKALKGDFIADFYPANTKSVTDVEIRLEELGSEYNFYPDIIFWDYPDLMQPIDYRIKEKRLQIQAVYFDIIRLHKKRDVFGFGLSQVGRNAAKKSHRDETDFSEDFGKAANAHATFSLERDEYEREAGVMRVAPVVQRDGVPAHSKKACFVRVDESRMSVKEIDKNEWVKAVEAVKKDEPQPKPKSRTIRRKLRDE